MERAYLILERQFIQIFLYIDIRPFVGVWHEKRVPWIIARRRIQVSISRSQFPRLLFLRNSAIGHQFGLLLLVPLGRVSQNIGPEQDDLKCDPQKIDRPEDDQVHVQKPPVAGFDVIFGNWAPSYDIDLTNDRVGGGTSFLDQAS